MRRTRGLRNPRNSLEDGERTAGGRMSLSARPPTGLSLNSSDYNTHRCKLIHSPLNAFTIIRCVFIWILMNTLDSPALVVDRLKLTTMRWCQYVETSTRLRCINMLTMLYHTKIIMDHKVKRYSNMYLTRHRAIPA